MNRTIRTLAAAATLTLLGVALPAAADVGDPDDRKVEVRGPDGDLRKLARVHDEVVVDVTPEEAWAILADFGQVQDHIAAIVESDWVGEPGLDADAARYCDLVFGKREVHVKERIFELVDGESFTYDVYDWTNFPLKHMHVTFGVRVDEQGQTRLYNVVDYRLKPGMMTGMMRGRMHKSARSSVLAFKHALETGQGNLTADELLASYPDA